MNKNLEFILQNYEPKGILKTSGRSTTELVWDVIERQIYIRKSLNYRNGVYQRLQKISSRYIPKIYFYAEESGKSYIIEEYIKGRTLLDVLQERKLIDEDLAEQLLLQLCAALEALHSAHIIHRDIKPSNIMLRDDNSAVLIDYDAARVQNAGKRGSDTVLLGTPGFAPPEQYGFSETDMRSDFYALGMTLKEALGKDYCGRLSKVLAKCTEFDPKNRIASTAEVKRLLQWEKYKKYFCALVLLCAVGCALGYWQLAARVEAPAPQLTQSAEEEKITAATPQQITKEQTPTSEAKQDAQTENTPLNAPGKPPAVQREEKPSEKAVEQSAAQASSMISPTQINFVSENWDQFYRASRNEIMFSKMEYLEQRGFTFVKHHSGKWPRQVITNNSGSDLKNPVVTLHFTNFAISGSAFTADLWGGRTQKTTYADIVWREHNHEPFCRSVTLSLNGTVPAHDYIELYLFGGVSGYCATGGAASVTVTLSADNAETITKQYSINI